MSFKNHSEYYDRLLVTWILKINFIHYDFFIDKPTLILLLIFLILLQIIKFNIHNNSNIYSHRSELNAKKIPVA